MTLCRCLALGVIVVLSSGAASQASLRKRGLHWSKAIQVGRNGLDALSCPSASLCVAGSGDGLLVSTSPAGGTAAWKLVVRPPTAVNELPQVLGVSCPSVSFCAAVTAHGDLLTSTNPVVATPRGP